MVDDESRENEGDIVFSAAASTPAKVNFCAKEARGLICIAISKNIAQKIDIHPVPSNAKDAFSTAFHDSIDATPAFGITTGISAKERSITAALVASDDSKPDDFIKPGHLFPVVAKDGGVLIRPGHTEAGVALAELTGGYPAALLSEIVAADGSMARGATLTAFAQEHQIPVISIAEIKSYQEKLEPLPKVLSYPRYEFEWVDVQLESGLWSLATYPSLKHREQVVMRFGAGDKTPLVRLHSECFTGDVVHSQRCDCGQQLKESMAAIEAYGYGYVLYLRDHEGRGIGLTEKLKAYILQNEGLDTVDANLQLGHSIDSRDWSEAISILKNLGLASIQLLTNNPEKVKAVAESGIACQQIPLLIEANEFNKKYLDTKAARLGHLGNTSQGGK